ncbi:MAG: tRNA pseudouridine(55) synthase TruB [Azoarcus sp.]|nr:tRNA pseudouridine(55) synthase TruB [Azoarcus sp.]
MQRKIIRRRVDGVLLLDKPTGVTSNGALQTARRLLNAAKAGHTGTLDPMASGLLPLTFGEATKFSQMLLDADKAYEAGVQLGVDTDTGDAEGQVLATNPVAVDEAQLRAVLERFVGDIEQVPPMYSALKRNGKPLYEYARAGIEVERSARRIRIAAIELVSFDGSRFTIRVDCSKGTYIRTLAMDIGAALGCGAHLCALRRTRIGEFVIAEGIPLSQLEEVEGEARDALLAPADTLVSAFPRIDLDAAQAALMLHGQPLSLQEQGQGFARIYGPEAFLGLAEWKVDGKLWAKRLIATGEANQNT